MTDFTRDWIAKREQLEEAATEGPWDSDGAEISQHWSRPEPWETIVSTYVSCGSYCYGGSAAGVERGEDAEFIADARTSLPAALAALRVVLELHKPDDEDLCRSCYGVAYPCLTVAAIEAELRSES